MRKIRFIVLHCTGTKQNTTVASIQRYWKEEKGWNRPGYHRIILPNGDVVKLESYDRPTNGVKGHNSNAIHICYIGGIDAKERTVDNRTPEQLAVMEQLVREAMQQFPEAQVLGHRDFPGVTKDCPSFDVKTWLKSRNIWP